MTSWRKNQFCYVSMQSCSDVGIETPVSFHPLEVEIVLVAGGSEKARRWELDRRRRGFEERFWIKKEILWVSVNIKIRFGLDYLLSKRDLNKISLIWERLKEMSKYGLRVYN